MLGISIIKNIFIQQEVSEFQNGKIIFSYTESYPLSVANERSTLHMDSMVFFYFESTLSVEKAMYDAYLTLDIFPCHVDVQIVLRYITIHITFDPSVTQSIPFRGPVIDIKVYKTGRKYQIDLQSIQISGSQQKQKYALAISCNSVELDCPISSPMTTAKVTVTDIKVIRYNLNMME